MTIATDLLGMGAPLRLALRHVIIASPPAIALQPGRIGVHAQPLGGRGRQGIQGSPQRLGHAFETVQGADGPEHMGGVGALPAPGAQQLQVTAQRQKGVEQMLFRASCHETAAELAQNRSVEARVGQFQSQQILPIDAAADGIGRPPVGQVLGELEQGHQRQPPRAFRRLPARGEEGRELGVGENRPKLVAQAQIGIATGKGRTGNGCGRSWNITAHGRAERHGTLQVWTQPPTA